MLLRPNTHVVGAWHDQGHLHPLHRASQSGNEPGTSCTAGEHFMQRAIRTALLTTIRNLGLYYYSSPLSRDVASSWLWDCGWVWLGRGYIWSDAWRSEQRELEQGTRTSIVWEGAGLSNLRTALEFHHIGSPLCMGLTRATYILCIKHPRQMRLSQESNPAIQTALLTAIQNLGLYYSTTMLY